MTVAVRNTITQRMGVTQPRIAPITPAKSRIDDYSATAKEMGIDLMPWQTLAARHLVATHADGWRYQEVAIVVARQNGKTELLLPRIRMGLEAGERILHTAQNRTLPRKVFMRVAHALPTRELVGIRFANGQEEITMRNGGSYTIIAPQRGARGLSADTLIFDEVREFEDFDVIAAATPTLTTSRNPQTIYLSNAGSDASIVLNDLKRRGEEGGGDELAYLEWSAGVERDLDDRDGWAEANPSMGYFPMMERTLEVKSKSLPAPDFETEHLCRWVASMQPKLVPEPAWMACQFDLSDAKPVRPAVAFNMDASGERASAAMAWPMPDGRIALVELAEAIGEPINLPKLGNDLKALSSKHGAKKVAFASWTDKDLARYVPRAEPLDGKEFANASENFARVVLSGRLAWDGATHITEDLKWTARKPHPSGAWTAEPASADRSITAVLAAIRAVWLASAPRTPPRIG